MSEAVMMDQVIKILKRRMEENLIPHYMHDGLINYLVYKRPVGDFLTAVLEGNLIDAANHADDQNKHLLYEYVRFLFNHAPRGSFGTKERVQQWLETGRVQREEVERARQQTDR